MIREETIYWAYRDGVPVKRLKTLEALNSFCADLRFKYPGSTITGRSTLLRERELFTFEGSTLEKAKVVFDA